LASWPPAPGPKARLALPEPQAPKGPRVILARLARLALLALLASRDPKV